MHATLLHLLHAASSPPTTAAKKTKSSSSSYFFLVIIGLFALVYFLVLRPRSQRARQQQTAKKDFEVGDEVVSIGGIVGSVVGFDGDDVEVDEGVVLTFLRRAINLKQAPGAPQARPSLFGRAARPAPAPTGDDDFDDDFDEVGGAVGDEPPQSEDTPGGGPDSPPTGR
jgi:preprotein translocase YajC subunit